MNTEETILGSILCASAVVVVVYNINAALF